MEKLTDIQEKIYNYIKKEIKTKGIAPSIREICNYTNLSSTSSVYYHLNILEETGYIKRPKSKKRCIEILEDDFYNDQKTDYTKVPIVGTVAAGQPILAIENIDGYYPVPTDYLSNEDSFLLKIKGQSMINAGILNNDLVLIRQQNTADNGDIVIALIDDSATCKRYFREKDCVRLQPENDAYSPILVKDVNIIGKVIALFRRYK